MDSGLWMLDTELWILDSGLWTLNSRCWTLNAGIWTLDLTICQKCLPCPSSGWIRLNIGALWAREKPLVQCLERRVCPRSVLSCGGSIKKSLKFDDICDGGCDVEVPLQKPLFNSSEEPNIFSLIATKLVWRNDAGGESQGCMQVASADYFRMREIDVDCSRLKPGARGEHLTSQLSRVTISHIWQLCLLSSRWIKALSSMAHYNWTRWFYWRFLDMVSMASLIGSWCYSRE